MSTLLCTQAPQVTRPLANFPPSIWGNLFTSYSVDVKAREISAKEHEGLKEKVRMMLSDYTTNYKTSKMIDFINTVERLGVSYHFEKEIEELLHRMFDAHSKFRDDVQDFDLFTLGIYFRILRQHGHKISCDIFNKLKGDNGEFKDELKDDVIGMLSLYEATQLRTQGESILDEALMYTKSQLESMAAASLSPYLAKQVTYALNLPLYKGIPRLEARNYISFYEEDSKKNDLLMRFSKIDFNLLQMIHKQELCDMTRWWKDWEFESKLSYARNRVVEAYLWILSVYYEPKYSLARIISVKIILLLSVIDDTYDAYGTRDELELFTDAIQRWDMSAITELPDYMKFVYRALLENYDEIEDEISKQENNCSYGIAYSIEMFKELARSYDIESIWSIKKYVPSFEEYLKNGLVTGANRVLVTSSFLGMGNIATTEAFEWVQTHKINVTSNTIVRLLDDIMSHEEEGERAHVATGVECYGKERGLNREEAVFELRKVIENGWKDFNEEFMKPNNLPLDIRMRALNLTRVAEVAYKYDDGYTHPEKTLKTHIISLLVNPIII